MAASPVIAASAAATLAVLAALAPGAAVAAEAPVAPPAAGPASQGFTLSARAGWAAPTGDLAGEPGAAFDDLVRDKTPLWLELGYRLDQRLLVGLFLEYAKVRVDPSACLSACDGQSVRFGADHQLQLAPGRRVAPWIGLGVALEFLELDSAVDQDGDGVGEVDGTRSLAGLELPLVEAGLDFVVSPRLRVGPYASFSRAMFTSVKVDAPGAPGARERIQDEAVHAWLQAGVKLTFDL